MNARTVGIVAVSVAVAVVLALVVWMLTRPEASSPAPEPVPSASSTVEPSATPSPSAGEVPVTDDGDTDELVDFSEHEAVATNLVVAYLTFDRAEPASARAARLAPFVAAGSPILEQVPAVAAPEMWNRASFNATVKVVSVDLTALSSVNVTDDTVLISVFVTYEATYTQPGQKQIVTDRQQWIVELPMSQAPVLAQKVTDPQ